MHPAPCQLPDQKAVDGAEHQFAPPGPRAGTFDVVKQPFDLGAREIGVKQQAGVTGDHRLQPGVLHLLADRGRAAVLPDDGVVDGLARLAVPDQGRFALVGDADGGDAGGIHPGLLDHRTGGARDGRPQVCRVMLHPAGGGEKLGEFLLGGGCHLQAGIKKDRAGRCRAVIDGKDMGHGSSFRQNRRHTAGAPSVSFAFRGVSSGIEGSAGKAAAGDPAGGATARPVCPAPCASGLTPAVPAMAPASAMRARPAGSLSLQACAAAVTCTRDKGLGLSHRWPDR